MKINVYGCESIPTLNLTVSPCTVCVLNYTIVNSPQWVELTESQRWIKSHGNVRIIPSAAGVRLDAYQTSNELLEPGFKVDSGALFVAKVNNGCSNGEPNLPNRKIYPGDEQTIFDVVGKLAVNQIAEANQKQVSTSVVYPIM